MYEFARLGLNSGSVCCNGLVIFDRVLTLARASLSMDALLLVCVGMSD